MSTAAVWKYKRITLLLPALYIVNECYSTTTAATASTTTTTTTVLLSMCSVQVIEFYVYYYWILCTDSVNNLNIYISAVVISC